MTIEIKNEKEIWVVWTNTDLTEGRGREFPLCLCESETTAIRLGRGRYVQGTDCTVSKDKALYLEGKGWFGPLGIVVMPSDEDIRAEDQLKVERAKQLVIDKFEKGEEITPEERKTILEILKK